MRLKGLLRPIALALPATLILAACGGDSTGTKPVPSSIAADIVQFSGTAGAVLAPSPTFVVRDAQGNILGGVPVTVAVTSGSAKVANPPGVTVASGPTSVGTVTIGDQAGPSTITVTVPGLTPLAIVVSGAADVPAAISVDANAVVSGFAGAPIVLPVAVRDRFGNGIPDITVTLTVTDGGGSVTPTTVTSGAGGRLASVVWTLGKSVVPQALVATGAGITSTIVGTVVSNYALDLRFFGPALSPEALASFNGAAARIRGSITGALSLITFPDTINVKTACGGPDQNAIGSTNGIILYASVDSIDGPGKVVAQSGPCFIRNANALPVVGIMKFDRDDIDGLVSTGRLANVVLHEMLHTVGFGAIWSHLGLISGKGTDDPRFTGALASASCKEAGGNLVCSTGVPVENCLGLPAAETCGAGTLESHWRETTFRSELMTGFVEAPGVSMPFSKMTIESLGDFGYTVNALAADPYTIPSPAISASLQVNVGAAGSAPPIWETTMTPRFRIDANRRVTRLPQ